MTNVNRTSKIENLYIPAIQELFAQKSSREILSGGVDKSVGEAAYNLITTKKQLKKEDFKEDIDFALINLDIYPKEEERDGGSSFLIKYITFFLSLQNYLGLKERKEERVTRLSSPPLEAYEYVGHNKLDFKESKGSYALLFED